MRRAIPDEGARPFEPQGILSALQRRGVRYVVIGGVGTILHGSPYPTADVDICPARDRPNLERLADALRDLDAKIYASELDEGLDRARDGTCSSGEISGT